MAREPVVIQPRMPVGPQGPKGDSAPEVKIQYSTDNSSWHDIFQAGDLYIRFSTDGGSTWTSGYRFVGIDGTNAPEMQIEYSADNVTWHSVFQTGDVYMRISTDGGTTWTQGYKFIGDDGADGQNAPNVLIQFSADNTNWHTDYQQGDAYVRFSNDNGVTWTNGVPVAVNADTVDGFDTSQTPGPNVIVPLDANGVLNLSATYVKSNVYTFRRVDLTNATSDYMLQVGEEAYISFSNTTSVPLRIATQSGTYYECHVVCSNTGGTSGGTAAPIYLNPNNTTYSDSFVYAEVYRHSSASRSSYITYSAFRCGWAFVSSVFYITNFVQHKNVNGIYDIYGTGIAYPQMTVFSTDWRDTTTLWTSLGTFTFPQATSGYIIVRRLV